VNHSAIITGSFPERTRIVSNLRFDPKTRRGTFIETADFLAAPTILERVAQAGGRTALLTSKRKLLHFLGRSVHTAVTTEESPDHLVAARGTPPSISSEAVATWPVPVLLSIVEHDHLDLVSCTITDYALHRWSSEAPEARHYPTQIDRRIGELFQSIPNHRLFVTADHGMCAKRLAFNPPKVLVRYRIEVTLVRPILDCSLVHHLHMDSTACVLIHRGSIAPAGDILPAVAGFASADDSTQTADLFHLPISDRGDLSLLGGEHTAFAPSRTLSTIAPEIDLRSHGSSHEAIVSRWGRGTDVSIASRNTDVPGLLGLAAEGRA
ncbi:MAG: alkaline phosphatase family protein, partial [Thermomicrobium sp.]